ncbi:unnamed protein product [Hermetia illucens]|uniref:Thioesterase domain-containing protein n=1 Tax=Hermetia illucens TaxID=343691 RepID=A0A7R8UIR8_HERIL|nr:acyl-coenzyme A thioesterase 13-like [Hermetia illucens]CAD7080782.1 unnamed protein product [Hermetia illucens]
MSAKKGVELLKSVFDYASKSKGFSGCLKNFTVTSGGEGNCVAEFTVSEEHLNQGGGLHGGFTATIVDNVTTYALMTKDKHPGVTVDLHVSYMKAARLGDVVVVDAKTIRAGKTLAYLECELRHKKDGSVIAKGTQTKYIDL